MSTKTQKIVAAITATALAASVMLGGTLAWQSINQEATNIVSGTINPGGRLHDDFDGNNRNKDIYVENFADQEIYARIQLREYLEIGTTEPGATTDSLVIPAGANHDATATGAVDTWAIHYFDSTKNATNQYVDFTWGGMTTYLPTFNMNKDSLLADINGTYEGLTPDNQSPTDDDEADRYSDYIDYATVTGGVTGYEVWDADLDNDDEVGENVDTLITLTDSAGTTHASFQAAAESFLTTPGDYTTSYTEVIKEQLTPATHIPATTRDATVISMADWKAMSDTDKDTFFGWVYDTDGWAYWSQPIEPKTVDTNGNVTSDNTTGLLLDAINPRIDDNYYYQIHVIAQFITANDLGQTDGTGFFAGDKGSNPSADALALLNTIGVNISGGSTLTVTSNAAAVAPGSSVTLTATNPTTNSAVTGATWIINGSNVASTFSTTPVAETSIDPATGILTVATNETASKLTVIAIFEDTTAKSTLIGSYDITVSATAAPPVDEYVVEISEATGATKIQAGGTLNFSAKVSKNGVEETSPTIAWTLADNTVAGTAIGATDGVLTVDATEPAGTVLTVTATYTDTATSETFSDTYEVTIQALRKIIADAAEGDIVTVNGNNYYVVVQDEAENRTLLWATAPIGATRAFDADSSKWKGSDIEAYLNGDFLATLTDLTGYILPTTITTADKYDRSGTYESTTNSVFLLSEADVYGAANGPVTSTAEEYTYGTSQIVTEAMKGWSVTSGEQYAWLRSPRFNSFNVSMIKSSGAVTMTDYNNPDGYVRPAFWVDIGEYDVTVTAAGDATSVAVGKTLQFSAAVTKNGKSHTPSSIVWSVDAGTTGSTIDPDSGLLTAGTTVGEVTVKATAAGVTGEYKVKVLTQTQQNIVDASVGGTVDINGTDYYVVAKDTGNNQNRALLWAAEEVSVGGSLTPAYDASDNLWSTSDLRATLNSTTFMDTLGEVKDSILEVEISTAAEHDRTGGTDGYETTKDSVFLLSQADVFGKAWNGSADADTSNASEYTFGTSKIVDDTMLTWSGTTSYTWLRSPRGNSTSVALLGSNDTVDSNGCHNSALYGVRPALWVNLDAYTVTVTAANDATSVAVDGTLQFSAAVAKNGKSHTPDSIVWSVDAGTTGSTIDPDSGLLTAGSTTGEVTVKATADGITGEYKVKVLTQTQMDIAATAVDSTITIDGTEWVVLAKQDGQALLWVTVPVAEQTFGSSNVWRDSKVRTYLNGTYYDGLSSLLKPHVVQTTIKTAAVYDRSSGGYIETDDWAFLLTEADVLGTVNGTATSVEDEYTLGVAGTIGQKHRTSSYGSLLRSPRLNVNNVACLSHDGLVGNYGYGGSLYVRPALWVNIAS